MTRALICEDFPTLTGRQDPHHLSEFPGDDSHGHKAVKFAGRVARAALPWQIAMLLAIMRVSVDGTWTHSDCVLICPRQNGKTLILVLRVLYGLFVLNERIIFSAQRWTTAEDAFKRLLEIIDAYPSLKRRLTKRTLSQGKGYLSINTGGQVLFCTRSPDTKGLDRVDLVIYDESYNLTEGEIGAINPMQLAAANPQTIYASTAVNVDVHANGDVLAGLRRAGLSREALLFFAEWMAPDGNAKCCEACARTMDRLAPDTWRYANPSFGVIQTEAKVLKVMRGLKTPAGRKQFDVEILGRGDWPADADDVPPIIDPDVWDKECLDVSSRIVGPRTFSAYMAPLGQRSAIAVVGRSADGLLHGEIVQCAPGSQWVIPRLRELHEKWSPLKPVVGPKSAAESMAADLVDQHGEPIEHLVFGAGEDGSVFATFYQKVVQEKVFRHIGQIELDEALAGAKTRLVDGGKAVAWDARDGADIIPVLALSSGLLGFIREESRLSDPMSSIW